MNLKLDFISKFKKNNKIASAKYLNLVAKNVKNILLPYWYVRFKNKLSKVKNLMKFIQCKFH